jgi:hypothetical protein
MIGHRAFNITPPRFRTKSDADKFMDCIRNRLPLPSGILIIPFIRLGEAVVTNPEYRDAPFECQYLPENL